MQLNAEHPGWLIHRFHLQITAPSEASDDVRAFVVRRLYGHFAPVRVRFAAFQTWLAKSQQILNQSDRLVGLVLGGVASDFWQAEARY